MPIISLGFLFILPVPKHSYCYYLNIFSFLIISYHVDYYERVCYHLLSFASFSLNSIIWMNLNGVLSSLLCEIGLYYLIYGYYGIFIAYIGINCIHIRFLFYSNWYSDMSCQYLGFQIDTSELVTAFKMQHSVSNDKWLPQDDLWTL